MYNIILTRFSSHDATCVLFNWPTLEDCWKAMKALWIQREYEFEFNITGGVFEARSQIMSLDNAVRSNRATIEDFKDLQFDL